METAIGQLIAGGAVSYTEVLEMTPRQVWFLFEMQAQHAAKQRASFVADVAAAMSLLGSNGSRTVQDHLEALEIRAGLATYTNKQAQVL